MKPRRSARHVTPGVRGRTLGTGRTRSGLERLLQPDGHPALQTPGGRLLAGLALAFRLDLDPFRIAELALRVFPSGVPKPDNPLGLYLGDVNEEIVDAATRLVALMSQPEEARLLGPLLIDEILIRLLRSPVGARVAQIGCDDSRLRQIAKAVADIRANFPQPLRINTLARMAHMSLSSFHQHFKDVTGMSPLQYQKALRLEQAKRLMLGHAMDAKRAANEVGYQSASQFTREYARYFGSTPKRDIARLRAENKLLAASPQ